MESMGMVLLLFCGGALTLKLRFVQFRRPFYALKKLKAGSAHAGGVTPFEALSTSLGACIGTGNIAGVAGAILLGGPGALVWMWLSALICAASKYAEIYYAQRYGGGPMEYMARGLPRFLRFLSPLYALLCLLACLSMGNLVQVNTVAEAAIAVFSPRDPRLIVGIVFAGLTAIVTFGGAKRVGRTATVLVPVMSLMYTLSALAVICFKIDALPRALRSVFAGAVAPHAFTGGAVGFLTCFRVGVARGVFTHEAGLGTAAIAHGATRAVNPHAQALLGVFEVFFDTILLCTLTALAILVSGAPLPYGDASVNGTLVIAAFSTVLGRAAGPFLTLALALFAITSILGFSLFGTVCAEKLLGRRAGVPFRLLFCALLLVGALIRPALAWRSTELITLMLAAINGPALLVLAFAGNQRGIP